MTDVECYITKFNNDKQDRMRKIRSFVFIQFPNATERIYYGIPTIEIDSKIILQYAAYKNHISLLVGYALAAHLQEKYQHYHYTRANVIFYDNQPLPDDFIKEVLYNAAITIL